MGSPQGQLWADTGAGLPILRLQTRSLHSDLGSWVGCVPEAGIRSSDFYPFPLGPSGRTEQKKMELESWLEAGSRNPLGRLLQELSAPREPRGPEGSGAGAVQSAKASRKQSSLSGKESAQGCIPKRLLGRPD